MIGRPAEAGLFPKNPLFGYLSEEINYQPEERWLRLADKPFLASRFFPTLAQRPDYRDICRRFGGEIGLVVEVHQELSYALAGEEEQLGLFRASPLLGCSHSVHSRYCCIRG